MTLTSNPSTKMELLGASFAALDGNHLSYCILTGCDDYPSAVNSDVDFMVSQSELVNLPKVIATLAGDTGSSLVQVLQHETGAYYFVLAKADADTVVFLHLDASSDFRRMGRLWLTAEQMFARRRYDARGFYVAADDDAFIYYLIKKIDKGTLDEPQALKLRNLFNNAPEACLARARQFWSVASGELFKRTFSTGNFIALQASLPSLAKELRASAPLENIWRRTAQFAKELTRRFNRVRRPTGLFVVFLGPDGSGKSSVIEQITQTMLPAFRRSEYFHLRPSRGSGANQKTAVVTDPHGQASRGFLGSTAKLIYLVGDYTLGYLLKVRWLLVRSSLVVFDRYYHDLLVDPIRYRHRGPLWLVRFIGKLVPKPDLLILLDAPAEVLQERKQEVPYEETSRQRDAYRKLVASFPNGVIVDASRPLPEVVNSVNIAILRYLEKRTRARLKL